MGLNLLASCFVIVSAISGNRGLANDAQTTTSNTIGTVSAESLLLRFRAQNSGPHLNARSRMPRNGDIAGEEQEHLRGRPSAAHKTAHAQDRHNLIEMLENPIFKHVNMDDVPMQVQVTLLPLKISDLNEKTEVLETTVRMQLTWQDRRLSWDPTLFSNLSEVVLSAEKIWAPDIAVLNSVSDVYDVIRDRRFEMKLEKSGRIWWHPTGILKTYCKLFLRYFPFDKQTCWFVIESPTLDIRFMNVTLRPNTSPVDSRMFMKGETWQLLGWGARSGLNQVGAKTYFARVEFFLRIERAKIYHILNVILPAVFLSVVQVMFFLVPVTHPQRLGSSTTTLLSVVVFQTVAISHLPNTSTDVPLLTIYIFFVVIVSSLSVSASVIVAKFAVYADQKLPLPSWVAKIPNPLWCLRRLCCCCCSDEIIEIDVSDGETSAQSAFQVVTIDHQTPPTRSRPSCKRCMSATCNLPSVVPALPLKVTASLDNSRTANNCQEPRVAVHNRLSPQNSSPPGQSLFGATIFDRNYRYYYQTANRYNSNGAPSRLVFANNDLIHAKDEATPSEGSTRPHLFRSWNDVSRYIDLWLMAVAASIALLSPVVIFLIIPSFEEEFDAETTTMAT